jgi:hypothetical protein
MIAVVLDEVFVAMMTITLVRLILMVMTIGVEIAASQQSGGMTPRTKMTRMKPTKDAMKMISRWRI